MVEQLPGHAAVEVLLPRTHSRKTFQPLPENELKNAVLEGLLPGVHAAHGEVAVADMELSVDGQAELSLQCW